MNAEAVFLNTRFKGVPTTVGMKRESGDPEYSGESGAVPATVIRYIFFIRPLSQPQKRREGDEESTSVSQETCL
jgi:hypothetical protein